MQDNLAYMVSFATFRRTKTSDVQKIHAIIKLSKRELEKHLNSFSLPVSNEHLVAFDLHCSLGE
ncbi:hypothetical protein MCO_00559 [Bartonella sp. DB5-6]|nr:hypothetical protein MCO_00559 [Bartonella sp. DB5-6]